MSSLKKTLFMVCTCLCLCLLMGQGAYAATATVDDIEYEYTVGESTATVSAYSGSSAFVTIPETVEEIGMFAFADCSQLQKVVFCGAGEIEIDETAFERSEKIVIYAPAGSYAETYAKEHNIPFVAE